jgi:hypothetical protein
MLVWQAQGSEFKPSIAKTKANSQRLKEPRVK